MHRPAMHTPMTTCSCLVALSVGLHLHRGDQEGVCKLDRRTGSAVLCRLETNWEGWAANMQAGLTARTEDNHSQITKSRVSTGLDWATGYSALCHPTLRRRTCLLLPSRKDRHWAPKTRRSAGPPPPCVVMRTEILLFPFLFLMAGVSLHQPPPTQPS